MVSMREAVPFMVPRLMLRFVMLLVVNGNALRCSVTSTSPTDLDLNTLPLINPDSNLSWFTEQSSDRWNVSLEY